MTTTKSASEQQMDRMISAATMDMLAEMILKLDGQERGAAEQLVFNKLLAELSKRLRVVAKLEPTEDLIKDFQKVAAIEYKTANRMERAAYWALSGEMEARFPEAAAAANEWLDALTPEELEAQEGNGWDKKMLAMVMLHSS